jgi:replicative DNA helicase
MNDTSINYKNIEATTLSTILFDCDGKVFDEVKEKLPVEAFSYYQAEYKAMLEADKSNQPINEDFIKKYGAREDQLIEILTASPIATVLDYIELLNEEHKNRKIRNLALIQNDSLLSEDEKLQHIKKAIEDIESSNTKGGLEYRTVRELLKRVPTRRPTFSTGLEPLDRRIGGLETGQLIYVIGREETGKSHITYKIIENISSYMKVAIISLEFSNQDYSDRVNKMLKTNKEQLNIDNITAMFVEDFKEGATISEVEVLLKRLKDEGINFVVLDSMHLVHSELQNANSLERLEDVGKRLFNLAKSLDMLLFVITTSSKDDHKTGNASVYGSQKLNHLCKQIWVVKRDMDTEDRMLIIAKNKQNSIYPKIPLRFWTNGDIIEGRTIKEEEAS